MQRSLANIVLFSSLQVLFSFTCAQDVVEAASGKGEFIFLKLLLNDASRISGH